MPRECHRDRRAFESNGRADVTGEGLTVPPDVVAGVARRWPTKGDDWANRVRRELPDLCARYDATPRRALPARYGFVVTADTPHGGLVFRASPDPDAPVQAQVAHTLGDLGVGPTVHDILTTEDHTWAVMDEVRPGTPLPHVDPASVTIESLAAPLAAMTRQPAPSPGMPNIINWLRERLNDDDLTDLAPGRTIAPTDERRAALLVLDDLAQDSVPGLCHGDVSTWNVLAHGTNGWKLIDPRGMSGEVAYDTAVLGLKIARHLPPAAVVGRLAQAASVDPERAHAWATIADAAKV